MAIAMTERPVDAQRKRDPVAGLFTVRRTAEQMVADGVMFHTSHRNRLRDVEDDIHALAEEWVTLRGIAQQPTAVCPLCGSNWRLRDVDDPNGCPCCRALLRWRAHKGATE